MKTENNPTDRETGYSPLWWTVFTILSVVGLVAIVTL